jgi:hypothetical protein
MAGGGMGAAQTTQSASPTTQGSGFATPTFGSTIGGIPSTQSFPSTAPSTYNSSIMQNMPSFLQNRIAGSGQPQPGQFGYGGTNTFAGVNPAAGAVPQSQRMFSPEAQAAMMRHRELVQQARTPAPAPVPAAPVQPAPRQPYRETAEDRAHRQQLTRERLAREEGVRQAGLRSIEGLGLNFNDPLTARSNAAASVPLAQQNMTLAQRKAFENEARRMR